jgi:ligand-binding sensor domain-containing protein
VPSGQEPSILSGDVVSAIDKSIFVIFEAKDNAFWFGSDGQGVYRWDGKAILHFTTAHGLSGNRVRSIQQDRSGNILVGSDGDVSQFDGRAFRSLKVAEKSEWKLAPDDLWFTGWQDEGVVYRYDGTMLHRLAFPKTAPGEDHIAKHPRAKFPGMIYSPYDVYTIFKDSKAHLWFGTASLGVCRYDGTTFAWTPKTELGFAEDDSFGLRSIAEDKDGRFWFSNTLHRFDVGHDQGAPAGQGTGDLRLRKQPGVARVKDLPEVFMSSVKDKKGDLWLATLRSGVLRYDGTRMTHYPVKEGNAIVTLYSIYRDRQDVLWVGTHEHGVYRFNGTAFEKVRF